MGAFGLESDSALGPAAGQPRHAMVAARLPRPEWPDRPMIVVAIDAHTGELTAFDRDSGVDLVDAVTASTALPGMTPTHSINGTHYINGGVRSAENADLASGYANIVVLSPFGGRSQTPPERGAGTDGQFEGLRKQGSRVEVITPDADSEAVMGYEPDGSGDPHPRRPRRFRPGQAEATRVTFL
jgi:NTE family protein